MEPQAGGILHRHRSVPLLLVPCMVLALSNASVATAQDTTEPLVEAIRKPALTADQIVGRLQEKNHEREMALRKLQGTRIYRVRYHGFFGMREAEAVISYRYLSPNHKDFVMLSQTGAKFILNHVIQPLLEGEKEAATEENRQRTALSAKNYDFTVSEAETAREPSQYVLNVLPKHDNKFLYRGKIWVDARDFAVTRIEAEPAKSPSFWVKKSEVHHRYEKIGDFWLPAENRTESTIRMGGRALLSIEYRDYQGIETVPLVPSIRLAVPTRAPTPFDDPAWVFELKHDGFRALAYISDGRCDLISRKNNRYKSFGPLREALAGLRVQNAILDGEIVCLDDDGRSQFIQLLRRRGEPVFYAFDLLWLNGEDLRRLPLIRLKERLRRLIDRIKCASFLFAQHIEGHGTALFDQVCHWDMDGIICKRKTADYAATAGWLKVMNPNYTQHEGRREMFDGFRGAGVFDR